MAITQHSPGRGEIISLSAFRLVQLMHSRRLSPVEVTKAFLDRIDEVNPTINAVVTLRREDALTEANLAESAIAKGTAECLTGLPFTVKDTIETAGVRTTAGSRLLANNVPTPDAPAVARLRSEGAILLGKTNTPEFAMIYSTDNALFGRTLNPWNLDLTVGGSSGGEAAVIAACGSPLGIGSDLGGSIRVPAALCRIVGYRPTLGRVPGGGHIPHLPDPLGRLSVMGPMARTVQDVEFAMSVLTLDWGAHDVSSAESAYGKLSLGFFEEDGVFPTAHEVKEAARSAAKTASAHLGQVEPVHPPGLSELYDLWDQMWEASGGARGLLRGYIPDGADVSPQLGRMLASSNGDRDDAALHTTVIRVEEIRNDMLRLMEKHPVLLCPSVAGTPTERAGVWNIDGSEIRSTRGFGYSYVWSLLGFPAVVVPWRPSSDSSPVGVQLVARPGYDEQLLHVARLVQPGNPDIMRLAPC